MESFADVTANVVRVTVGIPTGIVRRDFENDRNRKAANAFAAFLGAGFAAMFTWSLTSYKSAAVFGTLASIFDLADTLLTAGFLRGHEEATVGESACIKPFFKAMTLTCTGVTLFRGLSPTAKFLPAILPAAALASAFHRCRDLTSRVSSIGDQSPPPTIGNSVPCWPSKLDPEKWTLHC